MKGLVFIRHAETDLAGTFCGHTDPPLNTRGRTQVSELIARLASEPIEEIYSSDLLRAAETASLLANARAVPCTSLSNLREINFGAWEAMTWAEIEKKHPDLSLHWAHSFPNVTAPGGEPFVVFQSRVIREVECLIQRADHKRIAVVTHGGVMRIVLRELLGHSEESAWETTKSYCSSFVYAKTPAFKGVTP